MDNFDDLVDAVHNSRSRRIFLFRNLMSYETGIRLAQDDARNELRNETGLEPTTNPELDVVLARASTPTWARLVTAINSARRYTEPRVVAEPTPEPSMFDTIDWQPLTLEEEE